MALSPRFDLNVPGDPELGPLFLKAVRSLENLNPMLKSIPDAEALIESVPLQEALLSCRIENIVTSQDEVFRAYSTGEGCSVAGVRDVLGYHRAVLAAENEEISVETMEKVCSLLKGKPMKVRSSATDSARLVTSDGSVVFTPPSGDEVPGLLDELITYTDDSGDDPLLKMIVFHAYFEIIHPFRDGDGRTGRILDETLLRESGLLNRPVLNLSRFLIDNRREYYRCLRIVERDGIWNRYVKFMLTAVSASADAVVSIIARIRDSVARTCSVCRSAGFSGELVDLLYSHPYVRAKHLVEAGIASRNTASAYLRRLEAMGVLEGEQAGKGRIYVNRDLLRILSSDDAGEG